MVFRPDKDNKPIDPLDPTENDGAQTQQNNSTYDGTETAIPLLEWLADNYKKFGAVLEIVSDKSQEGAQFVRGFGGLGGLHFLHIFNLSKIKIITMICGVLSHIPKPNIPIWIELVKTH